MTERSEQLISMFLQNPFAMTEEQRHELSIWITQDTGNTKEFIKASLFHRCIHDVLLDSDIGRKRIIQGDTNIPDMSLELFDRSLWEMLLKEEETAPEIEIEHPAAKNELIQYVKPEKITHRHSKTVFLTVVTAVAALILLIIYVRLVPNTVKSEVATLTDTLNAQWAESDAPTGPNARLTTNHAPLMLRKGYAELVFDNNAKIVLEAPVEFQVLSYDQIKLSYGRLYATVPNEALGFVVSTPTSKVIDLGTEFGVQADFNGNMELHVTKGKTLLTALGQDEKSILDVIAGQARKVFAGNSRIQTIPIQDNTFVRKIDSKTSFIWKGQTRLSLADIVGGGNGFGGGVTNTGIDVTTGEVLSHLSNYTTFTGSAGYKTVHNNPYIDGVFVPGVGDGKTSITSDGSCAVPFPKTSGNLWGYVFNGAFHQGSPTARYTLQLDGVVFGTPDNPAITIHSNQGITFDLSEIRKSIPGLSITAFRSLAGVSQTVQGALEKDQNRSFDTFPEVKKVFDARHSNVEFWIFVDGRQLFHKKITSDAEAADLEIALAADDRFLTLATTESDDTISYDWALFGRPELILESADK